MIFTTNYNTVEAKPYDEFCFEKENFKLAKTGIIFNRKNHQTFIKYSNIKSIWTSGDSMYWGSYKIKGNKGRFYNHEDYYYLGITVANTKHKIFYGSISRIFISLKSESGEKEKNETENENEKQIILEAINKDFEKIKLKL